MSSQARAGSLSAAGISAPQVYTVDSQIEEELQAAEAQADAMAADDKEMPDPKEDSRPGVVPDGLSTP